MREHICIQMTSVIGKVRQVSLITMDRFPPSYHCFLLNGKQFCYVVACSYPEITRERSGFWGVESCPDSYVGLLILPLPGPTRTQRHTI